MLCQEAALRVCTDAFRVVAAGCPPQLTAQFEAQLRTMQPIQLLRVRHTLATRLLCARDWNPKEAWELASQFLVRRRCACMACLCSVDVEEMKARPPPNP